MTQEIWKSVVGFENIYSVSNIGRIRRDAPGCGKTFPGKILKQPVGSNGYSIVCLTNLGCHRVRLVHQLVAYAFLGPRPLNIVINHKNGIKTDNRLENLEYCTIGENQSHAYRIGIKSRDCGVKGSANTMARLTEENVREIRSSPRYRGWLSAFARKFNVNPATIQSVVHRRNWKHVA
jgi:hypothetical protein